MAADDPEKRRGHVTSPGLLNRGGIIKPREPEQSIPEGTGDPLRDAIIAEGRQAPLDSLRQHLTAEELEVFDRQRAAQNQWQQSPSEEHFNNSWFKPLDILDVTDHRLADDAEKWSIVQELQAGTIRAVARKAQISPNLLTTEHLLVIFPAAWRRMNSAAEEYFWKTGHLVVSAGISEENGHLADHKERYFDVRFDPDSFGPRPMLPAAPSAERTRAQLPPSNDVEAAAPPQKNKGGRPSGKGGEPIARITIRLMQLPADELSKQTAAALALDLMAEYTRLGLRPPVLSNAEREAAGILRALRY